MQYGGNSTSSGTILSVNVQRTSYSQMTFVMSAISLKCEEPSSSALFTVPITPQIKAARVVHHRPAQVRWKLMDKVASFHEQDEKWMEGVGMGRGATGNMAAFCRPASH